MFAGGLRTEVAQPLFVAPDPVLLGFVPPLNEIAGNQNYGDSNKQCRDERVIVDAYEQDCAVDNAGHNGHQPKGQTLPVRC